jgi:hypothetical protein
MRSIFSASCLCAFVAICIFAAKLQHFIYAICKELKQLLSAGCCAFVPQADTTFIKAI